MSYPQTERLRQLAYANLYLITNQDTGEKIQLCSLDRDITITGTIPSAWSSGTFLQSTANHSGLKLNAESTQTVVTFTLIATSPIFERYFISASTNRMTLQIYRCNNLVNPDFTADVYSMFMGDLSGYGFAGYAFSAQFTPLAMSFDKPLPRHFYQRICNHDLYGPGCGIDPAAHTHSGNSVAWNRYARVLNASISGVTDASIFSSGYMIEPTTESKISIITCRSDGSGNFNLYLLTWIREIETAQAISIIEGCPRTVAGCNRFANLVNFGGYPTIPTTNPSIDGVASWIIALIGFGMMLVMQG